MKKALVMGVASVALAAMPVVGVFAVQAPDPDAFTDTIEITVEGSCTWSRSTGDGTYEATIAAGGTNNNVGTSTFTSSCNNGTGYTVTGDFTSLAHTTGDGTPITFSDENIAANSGTWNAYRSGVTGGVTHTDYSAAANLTDDGIVYKTTGADTATASSFTVVYKVATHAIQSQGLYRGTATYTLAQNPASNV